MKTLWLVSLVLTLAAGPAVLAQTPQAPAAAPAAEQPLTASEIKKLRSDIQHLEFETVSEIRKASGGFGRRPDRNDPRVMTDDPSLIDRRGKPLRDAVPVSATHQKQLIELRNLDAKLKAAGAAPGR